jgi:hypothetical protein
LCFGGFRAIAQGDCHRWKLVDACHTRVISESAQKVEVQALRHPTSDIRHPYYDA